MKEAVEPFAAVGVRHIPKTMQLLLGFYHVSAKGSKGVFKLDVYKNFPELAAMCLTDHNHTLYMIKRKMGFVIAKDNMWFLTPSGISAAEELSNAM